MITSSPICAASVMFGIEQSEQGEMAGLPVLAVGRMEASNGKLLGTTDTLTNVVEALEDAGFEPTGADRPMIGTGRSIWLRDFDRQNVSGIRASIRPKKFADHAG